MEQGVKIFLLGLLMCLSVGGLLADDGLRFAPDPYPLYEVDSATQRIYYVRPARYTVDHFLGALDIPTCFGIGFVPDRQSKEQFAYYAAMFIEYRYHKTYGWYGELGLDDHAHNYKDLTFPVSANGQTVNATTGTINNLQLIIGGGYRIPLVRDIRAFYEHPYLNKWNLTTLLQVGGGWSTAKLVQVADGTVTDANTRYELKDVNYLYPVLKTGLAVEYFTSPMFSVFLSATYMQNLTRQPWNTDHLAGTLCFGIGLCGFFN